MAEDAGMTVFRHISRELIGKVLFCFLIFSVLYLLFEFVEQIQLFVKCKAGLSLIWRYFYYKLPTIVLHVTPLAILFGTLITWVLMARKNELTALWAMGYSSRVLLIPALCLALLASGLCLWLYAKIVPAMTHRLVHLLSIEVKKWNPRDFYRRAHGWYKIDRGFMYVGKANLMSGKLNNVTFMYLDKNFAPRRRVDAGQVLWKDGEWRLVKGQERIFKGERIIGPRMIHDRVAPVPHPPSDLRGRWGGPDELNFSEHRHYIRVAQQEGLDTRNMEIAYHQKTAYPLLPFVLALLATVIALRWGQRGGIALAIGLGLAVGFLYFSLMGILYIAGRTGALSPALSAWSPHILALLVGLGLMKRAPGLLAGRISKRN